MRNSSGETLISALLAALLLGLIGTLVMQVVAMTTSESLKLEARVDNIVSAKLVLNKLGSQIRQARNIGDVYGDTILAANPAGGITPGASTDPSQMLGNNVPDSDIVNGTATLMSPSFPSASDPFYGASGVANGQVTANWPGSPWPLNPYTLSGSCLIVQVPCFDYAGYPMSVPAANWGNVQALDTYVYQIIPDAAGTAMLQQQMQNAGNTQLYKLQVACWPAPASISNMPAGWTCGQPRTLLTNIVGPYDQNGNVCVFQYVNNQNITGGSNQNSITSDFTSAGAGATNASNLCLFSGVVANLQILNVDPQKHVTVLPLRTEMYLRNNADATIMCPNTQNQAGY